MSNNAFLSLSLGNPENPPANKRFKTLEISPWEFCRFKNSHGSKFRSFFPAAWTDPGRRDGIWKRGSVRRGLADIPQGRIYRTQQPVR